MEWNGRKDEEEEEGRRKIPNVWIWMSTMEIHNHKSLTCLWVK
jgi:hypothetical protein